MRFEFNTERHEYRVDGAIVPSVTRIISPLYNFDMVGEELLRLAAERGSAVHKATELFDRDDLDEESLDPQLVPYLEAWKRFRAETGFVPELIERQVYDSIHGYAGTLDRVALLGRTRAVVDIKTGSSLHPAVGVQLAAYQAALGKEGIQALGRYAVQLRPNGTYRLEQYTSPHDLPTFFALMTIARFKERNHV